MISTAMTPAAEAPPIITRSASALRTPLLSITTRAPAAMWESTKNTPSA